ncbi:MAG TPA: DUF6186 family protein [Actinomycetota bacterium]|nr:DUF6186 family protein [Actinomycetota bacterium]
MSRELIVAGYVVLALAAAGLELAARLTGKLPTLGEAVATVNRSLTGRWLLLAAWIWAGWHFFVRANWG